MTDLAALLKAATPDPPVDVSLAEVSSHARRRRPLAPLAAAALVLVLAAGAALVVTSHHRAHRADHVGAASSTRMVVGDFGGLHLRYPSGWNRFTSDPASQGTSTAEYLTNAPRHAGCRYYGCLPARPAADQLVVTVEHTYPHGRPISHPSRVVAGVPAEVYDNVLSSCAYSVRLVLADRPSATTGPGFSLFVCGGTETKAMADRILASAYFDRPAPTDLGIVTGRLIVAGGPAPGTPRPITGRVRVGSVTTTAGADGYYAVAVPPGSYVVTGGSPEVVTGTRPERCSAPAPARVRPGEVVRSDVVCSID